MYGRLLKNNLLLLLTTDVLLHNHRGQRPENTMAIKLRAITNARRTTRKHVLLYNCQLEWKIAVIAVSVLCLMQIITSITFPLTTTLSNFEAMILQTTYGGGSTLETKEENKRRVSEIHSGEGKQEQRDQPLVFTCLDHDDKDTSDDHARRCCAPWTVDGDEWWIHHPDWQVSLENETHYCFSPIPDKERAEMMKRIHALQWGREKEDSDAVARSQSSSSSSDSKIPMNCRDFEKSIELNAGYGQSMEWLHKAFWHAYKISNKPFQIVHNAASRWLYSTANTSSWAYCQSEDSRCYYLPISPCSRQLTVRGEHKGSRTIPPGKRGNPKQFLEFHSLKQYLYRPRQLFRKKLYEFRQQLNVSYPCATMHVRRGDAAIGKTPFPRYAAVQEYIDAAHLQPGDNIVLLSDDESTIREAKERHPEYNWIYLDRPRVQNIQGGLNGHIPSGDEAFELLAIHTELTVASSCHKIVHGKSSFIEALIDDLDLAGKNFTKYYVETKVTKEESEKFANQLAGTHQSRH